MWRDSKIGFPLCSVSSRATSSARSISFSPSFHSSRPRSRADIWAHGPLSAARAAAAAASTSARSADATEATTSSVAGLMTSSVRPPAALRHSPPMKSCLRIRVVVLMVVPPAIYHEATTGTTNTMPPQVGFVRLVAVAPSE
jgi:hypothetical protein